MAFQTRDRSKFDIPFPKFENPLEIGSFSVDINRDFENSQKHLRYFVKPKNPGNVRFDLRKGYDTMIKKEKRNEFNILPWIVANPEKMPMKQEVTPTERLERQGEEGASGRTRPIHPNRNQTSSSGNDDGDELAGIQEGMQDMKLSKKVPVETVDSRRASHFDVDFVCRRGLLAKLLCTPYEDQEGWIIAVTLHKGTYYLCEIETEQYKENEARLRDDETCCWGWKFEQYLTSDSPGGVPDPEAQYNNCEAFYTVVKTQINSHSLVFSGEVDALNVEDQDRSYYMEFKTCRNKVNINTFKRFKLKKWWAQSHIIGVKEMACGFRDDNGIVTNVKFYNTEDLPGMAQGIQNPWKPNVCFNFLDQFLSFIKSSIKTDDHGVVHSLAWTPGKPVSCSRLHDSEHILLEAWYTDAI